MAMLHLFLASILLCLCASSAAAQVLYGSLTGTVQDSTGALVTGAPVKLVNTATSQQLTATTNDAGAFTFGSLVPGDYDLSISAQGFRSVTRRGVNITVNIVRREDISLEVGAVSESVTVEAGAATLQTDKADLHTEISAKDVVNLPLPRYRNYQSLINLVPGATPGVYQNSVQAAPARALSVNVNGVNRNNNATRIDGALSVFLWLPHHTAYIPPAETIETVNIATNNFDAEQGLAGGAAITVITKSGTNNIHGSAWALHDNRTFQARNFFNPGDKPQNINNINGVTIGGPVRKNKLFYFFGWEGVHERQGATNRFTVPTADQKAGNFSAFSNAQIYDPASSTQASGAGRSLFPNNTIPASRISAITRRIQDLVPLPNLTGVGANFLSGGSQRLDKNNFDTKINWQRTATNMIWGKYSAMNAKVGCDAAFGQGGGAAACPSGSNIGDGTLRTQVSTVGSNYTFTPTFLWDGLFGWTRQGQAVLGFGAGTFYRDLGIPGISGRSTDTRDSGAPVFTIAGYTNHLSDTDTRPFLVHDTSWTTQQNFSLQRTRHDIRFGFEGLRHVLNHYNPDGGGNGGPMGRFDFAQGTTSTPGAALTQFNSYAAYLLGLPQNMRRSAQYEVMTAYNWQLGWYVRDRWQVTQKLTLSLGLRYELFPLQTRAGRGGIEGYDPATNLVSIGGLGNVPKDLGISTSKKLFAPRIGIAYRLNDTTVIRTGYGIAYNPMPLARPLRGFFPLVFAANFNSVNTFQPVRTLAEGIPDIVLPDISSGRAPLPTTASMRFIHGNELNRGYVQSWNFTIERQLPGQVITSVAYVGTQTTRSFADKEINAAPPGGGAAGRPLARFGRNTDTWAWNGYLSANYHALQIAVNKRAASGLTLKGAYTFSKAINWTDEDGWTGTIAFNWDPVFGRNRAQAGFNIPQTLQMGFIYETPFGKGKKYANGGAARWILGDWQVNGVFASYQGRPFTVGAAQGALNAPGNTQTADQVKDTVTKLGGVGPGQPFYDPTAFAAPVGVRFGSSGRNLLRGPGAVNLDLGLFRKFAIHEKFTLEFRGELANSMNTPHFNNPAANINAANFLVITSAQPDQRQGRVGLRLIW